jgi:hypothetical protein
MNENKTIGSYSANGNGASSSISEKNGGYRIKTDIFNNLMQSNTSGENINKYNQPHHSECVSDFTNLIDSN